jgi:O-antigen/teichoic acid export membrane protein
MSHILNALYTFLGIKSKRTQNISKHILLSFFFRASGILISLLLVPLSINYLGVENYGVWLTIASVISWLTFFDIGLGHGLRNKFAEAFANDDKQLAREYVSSAYFSMIIISTSIIIISIIINLFVDWSRVFNTQAQLKTDINILVPIILMFFSLQLIAKLITAIYFGAQKHSVQNQILFIGQLFSLLTVFLLLNSTISSLLYFGIALSFIPLFVLVIYNIIAFKGIFNRYKPEFSLFSLNRAREVLGIGSKFFVIQLSLLILFSTDNIIISQLFSPADVVPYEIARKYFSLLLHIFLIISTPYWSSFTEAYVKDDINWIKTAVIRLLKIWCLIPLLLIIMYLLSDYFYFIWVGDNVRVPKIMSILMASFVLLSTFNAIFTQFLNGVGKIQLQMYSALFSIVINIPLSIYFAKYTSLGVSGVILATCISLLVYVVLRPIQYWKIINKTAVNIWNK